MKTIDVFTMYISLVQKVHDQDVSLLKLSESMIDDTTCQVHKSQFDRMTLRLLRLNLAKHLMRCRVLKALGLTHLLADEGKYVSVAQRLLRSCHARHPELIDRAHQESMLGQLEAEKGITHALPVRA